MKVLKNNLAKHDMGSWMSFIRPFVFQLYNAVFLFVIAFSISSDITCNLGLFFLIFGFVSDHYPILLTLKYKKPIDKNQKPAHTQKTKIKWALAALFMRLFRLRKVFSTSLAVSKVRSEDCIPSLTNSIYLSLSAVWKRKLQHMN
jgi:hypothetical protein